MRETAYRLIQRSLIGAAVCAATGGIVLMPDLLSRRPVPGWALVVAAVACLIAMLLFVRSWRAARALGQGLEDVRTAVLNLVADRESTLPAELPRGSTPEVHALLNSLTRYQDELSRDRSAPDRRLISILAALPGGVVLMTEAGQVSLLNHAARELLGGERARVGTSLFATLNRDSVLRAVERAQKAGRTVETLLERLDEVTLQGSVTALPDAEGAVLIFPPSEVARHRPGVEFDLELHDVPPARVQLTLDIALADLPSVIVDTETTGLDARNDRVVSVGAVCAHGTRLFKSRMMDDLVDPGLPIPPASTKIHHITDAMVADARVFPEVWADFQRLTQNRVIVGHSIPFDLTILREECARHQRPWEDLVFIDTMRLASLLNPTLGKWDLESLTEIYHIDLHGRHTALGDALVTAELFFRMIPRLQQQGVRTLGQLLEFHCKHAVEVIAVQRHEGWITEQPARLRDEGAGPE